MQFPFTNKAFFTIAMTLLASMSLATCQKKIDHPKTVSADMDQAGHQAPKNWLRGGKYQIGGVVWNIHANLKPGSSNQISFKIDSNNSKEACGNTLQGTATTTDTNLDPDLLEASDGMTPVYTYTYESGQCLVQISIDYPNQKRVWITEQNCASSGTACPLAADDWLKLQ